MRTITAHIQRVITRARRIWHELDYVQRRSFELQTGISALPPKRPARTADRVKSTTHAVARDRRRDGFQ